MPTAANQTDPEPSTPLTGEGPVLVTRFADAGFEPRTLDQVVEDLGGDPIDWTRPVGLRMQVKARWQASGAPVGSFSEIRAGILVFDYDDDGSLGTVTEATFGPADNDTWQDVLVELVGQDTSGNFLLGMFGSVDFVVNGAETDSPQLELFFDNLRLIYTPVRNKVPTMPLAMLFALVGLMPLLVFRLRRTAGS